MHRAATWMQADAQGRALSAQGCSLPYARLQAFLTASAHGLNVVVHHLLLRGAAVDTSHPDG